MSRIRSRIWELVEVSYAADDHSPVLDWYDAGMMTFILLNVLAVVIESVEEIGARFTVFFSAFEVFSVAVFTIEYMVKLWACTADARYAHPVLGRVKYALTPMVIIDLLTFLPFYLWFLPLDLRFLRALRLFRLLRVLKLGRYSQSVALMGSVFRRKRARPGGVCSGAVCDARYCCKYYVLRRERSAARSVFVDPCRYVAGRRHLYDRRVWRCVSDHAAGQDFWLVHCHSGDWHLCVACRYSGVGVFRGARADEE